MGNKLKLAALLLFVFTTTGWAQNFNVKTDSISLALYDGAQWRQLIRFGKEAVNNGEDSPFLRLRIGYASFVRGNYSDALMQYDRVLRVDKRNQIALYYSYLCNIYLNRPQDAGFLAKYLDSKVVEDEEVKSFKLIATGAESGIKFTNIYERGNSSYSRAFVNMRLSYKLSLATSLSYYNQPVRNDKIEQPGYFVKFNYTPFRKISFIGAYHYMRSNWRQLIYQNHVGLFGIRYADGGGDLQGDFILSHIGDEKTKQFNLKLTKYISGNLGLYNISKFSIVHVLGENNPVFQQLIGIKPVRNVWFEGEITIGNQYNYAEDDATYIYNGFDKTKFKSAANCYFLLNQHLLLGLNYTFERKSDNIFKFDFLQHSINGGITWNF